MNYWITAHYPPHEKDFDGPFYYGVFVQDGKEHVAREMRPGDLVFKYEALTGPSRKITLPSGKTITQVCPRGHQGIVAVMEVTSPLQALSNTPTEYTDGNTKWWRHYAAAVCKDADGFVSLEQLNAFLGYAPNYSLRGFGDANSGLKQINKATFDKIHAAFKQGKKSR